jgi:hypothetical protein
MRLKLLLGAAAMATALTTIAQADPMSVPAMEGPITANANPTSFDTGYGSVYVTGAVSGLVFSQSNPAHLFAGDNASTVDLSNAQVFLQKTDGWLQFFVQAGAYSLPSLGASYIKATDATKDFFGAVPQAYLKIAPTDSFSFEVGKLPTLEGAEYTFTFENMNIERGLLWNQETAVSRGIQLNYSSGPLSMSVSWNDGYYSNRFNWVSGLVSYAFDSSNTLAFVAAGNTGRTGYATLATPYFQNNGELYNLIYTYNSAPWLINPYIQYSRVPSSAALGIPHSASMWGFGLLTNYSFSSSFNLSGRVEYETSSGSLFSGAPSLLYGPGSKAWSFTLTPTYQYKIFFVRAEGSYVKASHTTPGFALGSTFTKTSQSRIMLETGIVF